MASISDKLVDLLYGQPDIPQYSLDVLSQYQTTVDEKDTLTYKIEQQTNKIIESYEQEIEMLKKQLSDNNDRLNNLYKLKEKELEEAKNNEKNTIIFNTVTIIIAIISLIIAICAWIFPR